VGQEVTEERTFSGQEKDIIDYMTENGSITTLEAFGIGVARLASRVFDLRTKGIPIKREMVDVLNRKGEKCRVARYWLAA
jgi:EAL domain-containing protein (putative c-di-GMP-specific phosphodiesterase class I)